MFVYRRSATLILSAVLGLAACNSAGSDKGGKGGESSGGSDGNNEGGSAGENTSKTGGKGGKGGSDNTGTKGSGGTPDTGNGGSPGTGGGSAGTGGGSAGAGGSKTGGAGGTNMSVMGGAGGTQSASGCTPVNMYAGKPDSEIPKELLFCEPTCIYRPNWPGHHTCGPANSVYKAVPMKNDGFCGAMYNQDGIFTIPRSKIDTAATNAALAGGGIVNSPVAGVARAYLPGGTAGYEKAAAGQVALSFWTSGFSGMEGTHKIENIHEYLVSRGEIPYTIAVFIGGDMKAPDRIKQLKNTIIPALKQKWPKISDDPNYRSMAGQSTAGADSFDVAWLGTDVVAKAIGGSSSVACFTCMGGQGSCAGDCPDKNNTYVTEVKFCPARPIRFTSTVGTCDIHGTLAERLAAGCGGGVGAGDVDASSCKATWPKINRDLMDALKAKGMPYQLFVIQGGGHTPPDWSYGLAWQLRWAFKDIVCKQ